MHKNKDMKKLLFFFSALFALLLTGCTEDEINNVIDRVEPAPAVAVENIAANFGEGSMSVSTTGNLLAKAKARALARSRALSDYETPSSFAAKAKAVTASSFNPLYTTQPSADGAIELSTMTEEVVESEWYSWTKVLDLQGGSTYIVRGNEKTNLNDHEVSGDGYATVIIPSGVTVDLSGKSNLRYIVCEGATLNITYGYNQKMSVYCWGTLNFTNGIYQASGGEIYCFGKVNASGTLQFEGTFYTTKDLDATVTGGGKVYVGGNFNSQSGFGLSGSLYVGGQMSGNMNFNNGIAAHVGSINTSESVNVATSSQLLVEGNVTANGIAGSKGSVVGEIVVKGTANISGDVVFSSSSKAYFDNLQCQNFTEASGDVWVGCQANVREKFELNAWISKFTLTSGAYLHAGEANFSSTTKMEMMSNSYFKVDGKLQLNNANDQNFNGSGELAIVRANTIGANFEDFSNTFTGNIGVDFIAWDYSSSTGLIDQNVNLKRMSGLTENLNIAANGCKPAYQGQKVRTEDLPDTPPTEKADVNYTVYYLEKDTHQTLHSATTATGKDGETVTVTALPINDYSVYGSSSAQITLNKDGDNTHTFYYTKNAPAEIPIGYSVYYLYRANGHSVTDPKVVQPGEGYVVGDVVTEYPKSFEGLEANPASPKTITLQESQSSNEIKFYYDVIPPEPVLAECLVKFVDRNGVAVAPFYTIEQYIDNWAYAEALEIAGYELDGESRKGCQMTGVNDVICFVYRQLGDAPIVNNNPVNPPAPDINPEFEFNTDGLSIDLDAGVEGEWIIQADDFAIHNGDILYESIADMSNTEGHSAYNDFVVVYPRDNVTITLNNINSIYNTYKGKTTTCQDPQSPYYGQAVPYINQVNGMLTLEVYLWPAKYDDWRVVPIPANDFLGINDDGVDGLYLIGTENGPRVYANDDYFVQVSAYASYNGGGNDSDMTSYIKVSFHISPRPAAN